MRKAVAVGILALGLALIWLQARAWLSHNHLQRAQALSARNPASAAALKAATISTQQAPWLAEPHAELSWRLQNSGRPLEARRQFALALSSAPADAYLWAEYAQLLVRQRKFGRDTEWAVQRSNRLGPSSRVIQWSNAVTGLQFWSRGSSVLQEEWLHSMRFILRNERQKFLLRVKNSGRTLPFCLGPGTELPVVRWCAQMNRSP